MGKAGIIAAGAALWLALIQPAAAFDAVPVPGLLSDPDFFRAATCGAPPSGPCQMDPVRWPRPQLTLAVQPPGPDTGLIFRMLFSVTIDYAIAQINAAGAGLTLTRIAGPKADIRVSLTDVPEGSAMPDIPGLSSPGIMGVGYTTLWWTPDHEITEASVLISASITPNDIISVVLEELFQATGPLFDIDSPAYEGVSILSQTSNATVSIAGQDARLLRWLYPPQPTEAP